MTTEDELAKIFVLFGGILAVLHIAKVIFTLDRVLVATGEIVLRKLEGDGKQGVEGVQDLGVK